MSNNPLPPPPAGDTAPAAAVGAFVDPYRSYSFKLMFNPNIAEAHFTEVSGFGINVQPIKYREGGSGQVVHALPGMVEYEDITLRYGLTASHELWDWFMLAVNGKVQRRNVSIILLDADGVTPRLQWDLTNAWPTSWRGSVLNALSREVAIESLTLTFEELKRA